MKAAFATLLLVGSIVSGWAATSINAVNKFAYGANIGWMDWRGNTNSGAVIGEYVCSGYIWAANVGWIHLGSNAPANGIRYLNNSATDYGVNHDGLGNLSGYAYGANIGWVTFTNATATGALASTNVPHVDLKSGKLSGFAYSANCGWISLSNAFAHVQTDTIQMGADTDADGIADGWERTYTNTLTAFTASSDTDGDGMTDKNEYLADTNPKNANDRLRITTITHAIPTPSHGTLLWDAKPTRCYAVQHRTALDTGSWTDFITFQSPGTSGVGFDDFNSEDFFRIRAFRPLSP